MSQAGTPYQIFRKQSDQEKAKIERLKLRYGPFTYSHLPLAYPYHAENICWTMSTYQARVLCSNYFDFCKNNRHSSPLFLTIDDFHHLDANWVFFDKLMRMSVEEAILALSLNPVDRSPWDLLGLELSCAMTALAAKYVPSQTDTPLVQYEKWPEHTRIAMNICEQYDAFDDLLESEKFWMIFHDFIRFLKSNGSVMDNIKNCLHAFEESVTAAFKKRHSH